MFGSGVILIDSNKEAGPDTLTENADPYCGPAPDVANLFRAWNLDPVLMAAIALVALWLFMKSEQQTSAFHRAMIILLLIAAFVSPLCALTTALFSVRIVHHILLVAVIAPMLAIAIAGRVSSRSAWLTRYPELAFIAHTVIYWAWHLPPGYSFALSDAFAYWAMQLVLLATAVWLWSALLVFATGPIMRISLALSTMVQMGFLAAILTFAPYPLFSEHLLTTTSYGLTPLEDQQLSGLIMWTLGLIPYLIVALASMRGVMRVSAGREGE